MKITNFSNYGNLTTIFAPGEDIIGASPNNQFESMQGTSMASPIVAGIMAVLKSRDKNLTINQAIDFLNQNSIISNNNKLLKIK
jgi:subtilisin family serine protease